MTVSDTFVKAYGRNYTAARSTPKLGASVIICGQLMIFHRGSGIN